MNSEQSQGYRNTIERLPPSNDMPENCMKFDVGNHDDPLDIMNRIRSIESLQTAEANASLW